MDTEKNDSADEPETKAESHTPEAIDKFLKEIEPQLGENWDQWKIRLLRSALPEWWPDEQQRFMSSMRALIECHAEERPVEQKFRDMLVDWDARSVLNGDRIFELLRNEFYRLTVERTHRPGWVIRTVTRPIPDRNRHGWPMFRTVSEDEMPKVDGRFGTLHGFLEHHLNFQGMEKGGKVIQNPNYDSRKD